MGTLWLQNKIKQKLIVMAKVGIEVNLSDLGTKAHAESRIVFLKELKKEYLISRSLK